VPNAAVAGQACGAPGAVCQAGVCVQTCLPPTANLQGAIDAAPAGVTVTLCAGAWALTGTIRIARNLTLIGAGAGQSILDGGGAVRVLQIAAGTTVTVQDLTITRGSDTLGWGIHTKGALRLVRCAVTGNTATTQGGGIINFGALLLTGTAVTGNSAQFGGGIFNDNGTVTLQAGSRVSGNTAIVGGAISNLAGSVTVETAALVCYNTPSLAQCVGSVTGPCPNPPSGICPA
jgi:hypothetical protein